MAAVLLIALAPAGASSIGEDSTPWTCDEHTATWHYKEARQTINAGWARKNWRNGPKEAQRRQVMEHLKCLDRPKDRLKIRVYWSGKVKSFRSWRAYRLVANTNCGFSHRPRFYYTGGAVSCGTIGCESGGNWRIVNHIGAAGAYQIIRSTWAGYGGLKYAPTADQATPREQSLIARKISFDGDQWVC